MSTTHSLQHKTAKLTDQVQARCPAQPDFAVIFYDPDQDADQIEQDTKAQRDQIAQSVKTIFYLPRKERLEGENYTGPYQAY